jgi:FixJ family two-component response regulator
LPITAPVPVPARARVAIVDDDPFVRAATSSLLRAVGWDARSFASAEDFIEADVATHVDCLVCDIHMTRMDGIGLLAQLRRDGIAVPTVFITALTSESVRHRALAQGALCVIDKPVDGAELEDWVRRALASSAASAG